MAGDFVEVERAAGAIDEGDAVEQESAREEGGEDVLGSGFGAFPVLLGEGHEGGHGHGGELQADEEHEEVAGTDHEVHAEQRGEGEDVEFTLLDVVFFAFHPDVAHEEDDECADTEHAFEEGHHGGVDVHASEGLHLAFATGTEARGGEHIDGLYQEEHGGQAGVERASAALLVGTHDEVGQEEDDDYCEQ